MGFEKDAIDTLKMALGTWRKSLEKLSKFQKGEFFILAYLYEKESEIIPSELSKALDSSTARVSSILRSLESKGEIARDVDKSNRNHVLVRLTDVGRERAKLIQTELDKSLSQVFIAMGKEETLTFIRLAYRFLDLVEQFPPQPERKEGRDGLNQ